MKRKVSIITPSYNSSQFIAETIESVISQTYQNWEMLIVDDCSKDKSVEIITKYSKKDSRIKLFQLNENVGAAEARNIALRKAEGRYIAFLDSDDLWQPKKLEKQLAYILSTKSAFVFSSYNRISENGKQILNEIHVPNTITYAQFLRNTIIGTLTVLIDKEQTDYFEMPLIRSSHDMALWCILLKRVGKAYGQKEILASYRTVSTSNSSKKWKAAKDVWRVYRNFEKLSYLYSIFNFILYVVNAILKRVK